MSGMLRGGLYTRVVGRRILYFRRLSSTMDEAARQAGKGTEEGTVVLGEEQTSGRGRFRRAWVSQPGNLYFSIVLHPSLWALPYLSIISGVAVARAVRKTTGLKPTIKWPNDVRLGGRKVCGILVENALQGDGVEYAVVGIGINVAFDPSTVAELAEIATGLNVETGQDVDREVLLGHVLQEMDKLYSPIRKACGHPGPPGNTDVATADRAQEALDQAREEWRGLLETLGTQVVVRWQGEVYSGYAEDVDDRGNLRLRQDDGTLVVLPAGEVTQTVGVAAKGANEGGG